MKKKTKEELYTSKEFILANIQIELYQAIDDYLKENNMSRTAFAEKLKVSKGYVSQMMRGEYDHKLSKFVELALSIGKVPRIELQDLTDYLASQGFDRLELNDSLELRVIEYNSHDHEHSDIEEGVGPGLVLHPKENQKAFYQSSSQAA